MTEQHNEIKSILDSAMLSDDPMGKFKEVLPQIQEYSSVDSAWISGPGFFVRYQGGGTVSWLLDPRDIE